MAVGKNITWGKRKEKALSSYPMILQNNDMPSGLFLRYMYSISVSKYGVIVYIGLNLHTLISLW